VSIHLHHKEFSSIDQDLGIIITGNTSLNKKVGKNVSIKKTLIRHFFTD